jgi:tetratricopeptide (TPR) repeat protein
MKTHGLLLCLLVLGLTSCDYHSARDEYDRQIDICTLAEKSGLLAPAVDACGAALAIAEEKEYEQDLISGLLYRLGRLERQRGNFQEAQRLVERSLALEEQKGDQVAVAVRLVELSLSLAGQGRWTDGAQLLERAAPLTGDLTGDERQAAANIFRSFSRRLARQGQTAQAEQFKAKADELAGS